MARSATAVRSALVAAVIAVALTACGGGDDTPSAAEPVPAPASGPLSFTGDLLGGGQLEGSSLAGETVLLWFWAPP